MGDVNAIGVCPRCGVSLHPVAARNALSRVDNKTYICASCGNAEAMYDMYFPGRELPDLSEPIVVAGSGL